MSKLGSIFDKNGDTPLDTSPESENNVVGEILDEIINGHSLSTPALIQNSAYFFLETLFYFITLVCTLGVIFFTRIAPFDIFADMLGSSEVKNALGGTARIQDLSFVVRLLIGTIAVLSFIIARNFHRLRKQRNSLVSTLKSVSQARKQLKT